MEARKWLKLVEDEIGEILKGEWSFEAEARLLDLQYQRKWAKSRLFWDAFKNLPRKSKTMEEIARENKKRYNQ